MDQPSAPERRRLAPEELAAIVNAGVMLLVPCVFLLVSWWLQPPSDTVPAWISSMRWDASRMVFALAGPMGVAMPFAAIVAWRTFVHAKHYLVRRDRWWQGFAEAAGVGAVIPVLAFGPAIVTNPLQAPQAVGAYAIIGAAIGSAFGVVLTLVAVCVLYSTRRRGLESRAVAR